MQSKEKERDGKRERRGSWESRNEEENGFKKSLLPWDSELR